MKRGKKLIALLTAAVMVAMIIPANAEANEAWQPELKKGNKTVVSTIPTYINSDMLIVGIMDSPMATANAAVGITSEEVKNQKQCPVLNIYDSMCGPKAIEAFDSVASTLGGEVFWKLEMDMYVQYSYPQENVTSFALPLDFCYAIPEKLFKSAAKNHREVAVLHIENGEVKVLTDLDDISNTITFEANSTGVFALIEAPASALDAYRPAK